MKIEIALNHKKYQPEINEARCLPEGYNITIERSDGFGLTQIEALTVLQTCIEGLQDSVKVGSVHVGSTLFEPENH